MALRTLSYLSLLTTLLAIFTCSCIEDGFTSSPSDQPDFSVDTLRLGTVFTGEGTATNRFVVRNRHSKGLSISSISLSGEAADCFRLNVDGMSGRSFSDVEIRAKDSIYIFVEATFPVHGMIEEQLREATLDFVTNGVQRSVVLTASGLDVTNISTLIIDSDESWSSAIPYRVLDSIVVEEGATLSLEEGVRVMLHDGASMRVHGNLKAKGTPDNPVIISGDRTGNVVGQISFDLMSRQWDGIYLTPGASANLDGVIIKNSCNGVVAEDADIYLRNSVLRNSGTTDLLMVGGKVTAVGCEFSEAGEHLVLLAGGTHTFNHCTFANNYLFASMRGAAVMLRHLSPDKAEPDLTDTPYTDADFSNCIIYGLGGEVSPGNLTGAAVTLRRCLLGSKGSDDDNFINCLWESDPLYRTVRADYIFDYRLLPDSPAIQGADRSLTRDDATVDRYGVTRSAELGAYAFDPASLPESEE